MLRPCRDQEEVVTTWRRGGRRSGHTERVRLVYKGLSSPKKETYTGRTKLGNCTGKTPNTEQPAQHNQPDFASKKAATTWRIVGALQKPKEGVG